MGSVWLVRHGESEAPQGLAVGWTDPPLGARGREQAYALAARLADSPLVRIVSSDLARCVETAQIIAAPHGLAVEPAAALRELDFGAWEGRSLGDLWTEDAAAAQAWEADVHATPASFGETLAAMERRVQELWLGLQPLPAPGDVAIVGHRGSLAVLRTLVTRDALETTLAAPFACGSALRLRLPEGQEREKLIHDV